MLDDGTYDVIVVDAEAVGDSHELALELTVLAGTHKGEMVRITATGIDRDPLDLLATPATLVVDNGEPRVDLED